MNERYKEFKNTLEKAIFEHLFCEGAITFANKNELIEFLNTDYFLKRALRLDNKMSSIREYLIQQWENGAQFLSFSGLFNGDMYKCLPWLYNYHSFNIKPYSYFKKKYSYSED